VNVFAVNALENKGARFTKPFMSEALMSLSLATSDELSAARSDAA
jgi:hypothetical protein